MPKVILGEENRREDALWKYIDSKIGRRCQYKTDRECAEKAMGVGPDTFSRWRNIGLPRFFHTLCRMFQRTHITDRQLCRIFGVEYKGDKVGTDSIEREDIK